MPLPAQAGTAKCAGCICELPFSLDLPLSFEGHDLDLDLSTGDWRFVFLGRNRGRDDNVGRRHTHKEVKVEGQDRDTQLTNLANALGIFSVLAIIIFQYIQVSQQAIERQKGIAGEAKKAT